MQKIKEQIGKNHRLRLIGVVLLANAGIAQVPGIYVKRWEAKLRRGKRMVTTVPVETFAPIERTSGSRYRVAIWKNDDRSYQEWIHAKNVLRET